MRFVCLFYLNSFKHVEMAERVASDVLARPVGNKPSAITAAVFFRHQFLSITS